MHWDFVLTSFEPITKVTGGIGTYIRCLIEEILSIKDDNINFLFLTPHVVDPDWRISIESKNLKIVLIDYNKKYGGGDLNYVGDEHSYFSFKVSNYLETLCKSGDTFGFIEFSDYGRDGYYSIKKKRLGLISSGTMAVRLHSPDIMLFSDNANTLGKLDNLTRYKFEQELYCYKYCDKILYGGEAMLHRVEQEANKYGLSIVQKSLKISHPFRRLANTDQSAHLPNGEKNISIKLKNLLDDTSKIKVCYSGRIEKRKGISNFFQTLCKSTDLKNYIIENNVHFIVCGRDTNTGISGGSLLSEINQSIIGDVISNNILFAGYISQEELYNLVLPKADAFIFPSLFENYPNAFIETLPYGKETLVSNLGCMPEIAQPFSYVQSYDPFHGNSVDKIAAFLSSLVSSSAPIQQKNSSNRMLSARREYVDISSKHNLEMRKSYIKYIKSSPSKIAKNCPSKTVSFIIPHFRNIMFLESCIISASKSMQKGDEIIVVDDCSGSEEAEFVRTLCVKHNVISILLEKNGGPSAARNVGFRRSTCDLIQFIDADDILDIVGFNKARLAIELNEDIEFIYGITHTFGETEHLWMPRDVTLNVFEENYTHSAILIRSEVFAEIGHFDESLLFHYEDWELNARLALLEKWGESIPTVTLHYRQKPGSRSISNLEKSNISRSLVVERAISNCMKFKHKSNIKSQLVYNLGVYFEGWIAASTWIEKLNFDLEIAKSRDSIHYQNEKRIAFSDIINTQNQSEPVSPLFIDIKSRIYSNNLAESFNKLVLEANETVLKMTEDERKATLRNSKFFDAEWYLLVNDDVKLAEQDPIDHFDRYGWIEKRNFNPHLTMEDIDKVLNINLPRIRTANKLIIFIILVE